jgi:hypothetical protein
MLLEVRLVGFRQGAFKVIHRELADFSARDHIGGLVTVV